MSITYKSLFEVIKTLISPASSEPLTAHELALKKGSCKVKLSKLIMKAVLA